MWNIVMTEDWTFYEKDKSRISCCFFEHTIHLEKLNPIIFLTWLFWIFIVSFEFLSLGFVINIYILLPACFWLFTSLVLSSDSSKRYIIEKVYLDNVKTNSNEYNTKFILLHNTYVSNQHIFFHNMRSDINELPLLKNIQISYYSKIYYLFN